MNATNDHPGAAQTGPVNQENWRPNVPSACAEVEAGLTLLSVSIAAAEPKTFKVTSQWGPESFELLDKQYESGAHSG